MCLEDGAAGRSAAVSAPRPRRLSRTDRRLRPCLRHLPRLASRAGEDAAVCRFRWLRSRVGLGGTRHQMTLNHFSAERDVGHCTLFKTCAYQRKQSFVFNGITPEHAVHISALLTCDEEKTLQL